MNYGLFVGLEDKCVAELRRSATERRYARGDTLFSQGEPARELFLIKSGRVKIWRALENGTVLTLTLLGPGLPIGTLGATDGLANHATASAEADTATMTWPLPMIRELMANNAALTANVLRVVTSYAVQMVERLEEAGSIPVEQRLARTLLRMSERLGSGLPTDGCELPLSRQDLAELTSATLPTISRIMSRWRNDGTIAGARGSVRLRDCERLRQTAQLPVV